MGFELRAVFSSPVDADRKPDVIASAISRWPFVRMPGREDSYPKSAHFAPPELTAYLHQSQDAYERAVEQCGEVEDSLPAWSTTFPSLVLAFIEVECFGGTCLYSGFACKSGQVILRQSPDPSGHRRLLEQVAIMLKNDRFAPFERGYFAS